MLWGHPYGGAYMVAEWLLSVIFWLIILFAVGALVLRPIRNGTARKIVVRAAKSVKTKSRRRKAGSA